MATLTKAEFLLKYNTGTDPPALYRAGQTAGIGSDDHRALVQDVIDSVIWPEDFSLTDWPISSGAPTGTIPKGKRYYLTGSEGEILGETVAEGTVMEARTPNPAVRADWYFNQGGS